MAMQPAPGGGGLQLGAGAPRLQLGLGNQATLQQQQQQQHPLQLSAMSKPGQPGMGGLTGLSGVTASQPVAAVAPTSGFNLPAGGMGLKLGASTATPTAGTTGLTGGTGLQLGLPASSGLSLTKPAVTSSGVPGGIGGGLQLGGLSHPPQVSLTGQLGVSQQQLGAPLSTTTAVPNIGIKPQTGLTGLTGTQLMCKCIYMYIVQCILFSLTL